MTTNTYTKLNMEYGNSILYKYIVDIEYEYKFKYNTILDSDIE